MTDDNAHVVKHLNAARDAAQPMVRRRRELHELIAADQAARAALAGEPYLDPETEPKP